MRVPADGEDARSLHRTELLCGDGEVVFTAGLRRTGDGAAHEMKAPVMGEAGMRIGNERILAHAARAANGDEGTGADHRAVVSSDAAQEVEAAGFSGAATSRVEGPA